MQMVVVADTVAENLLNWASLGAVCEHVRFPALLNNNRQSVRERTDEIYAVRGLDVRSHGGQGISQDPLHVSADRASLSDVFRKVLRGRLENVCTTVRAGL